MRAVAIWALSGMLAGAPPELPAEAPEQPPAREPLPESSPAPEPLPPEPPPVEEPLPTWDAPLPGYDEVPVSDVAFDGVPLEPEDGEPPSGRGRMAVGSILLGGGAVLTGTSIAMIILDTDRPVWIPGVVLGGSAVVTGAILVATGSFRRDEHKSWAAEQTDGPVPPRGKGMLAAGVTCMLAGSVGTIIGSISLAALQDDDALPYGQVMIPLGVVSFVTGVGLVVGGSVLGKKHERWQAGRVTPSISLLPGARSDRLASVGGVSFGVAGRF
jgi:hypothetical protein